MGTLSVVEEHEGELDSGRDAMSLFLQVAQSTEATAFPWSICP